ncbi:formyltransferase family protein [Herbaspirillum seropedicae]|uniref:formyltransferase family protein n=1 Tax=Herbaspirillum seropedicae TaxID=964 RepID=UPI003FCD9067
MQNLKLCVLGRQGDPYTRMVVRSLRARGLQFTLLLEGGARAGGRIERLLERPLTLYRALTSGRFKALPKLSYFTLRAFLCERLYYRGHAARAILAPLHDVEMNGVVVRSVNHVRTLKLVEQERFDIGLFAGVDIVDGAIIDAFGLCCLNAHPAPLPQCRGGGALINTLYYGLQPAASVHVATAGIDEGEILRVTPLPLRKNDDYDSINLRLTLLCADTLAEVAQELATGKPVKGQPNGGVLHYWKDCTIERQRAAMRHLRQLLKDL